MRCRRADVFRGVLGGGASDGAGAVDAGCFVAAVPAHEAAVAVGGGDAADAVVGVL